VKVKKRNGKVSGRICISGQTENEEPPKNKQQHKQETQKVQKEDSNEK
jgi:hypothetical protein